MNEVEIRRVIAAHLGWHTIQQNPLYTNDPNRLAGFFGADQTALCGIPDYLGDLNAMHIAEKSMTPVQCFGFERHLSQIIGPQTDASLGAPAWYWHATAAQRAEAFLNAVGKWVETPPAPPTLPDDGNTFQSGPDIVTPK